MNIYCLPKEFEDNICQISNPFIKSQWLNKIHFFLDKEITNICAISNSKGELFLMGQEFSKGNKYIYAFSKDGNGLFVNYINQTKYSFESFSFPEYRYTEVFQSVEIDNNNYLLSTQNLNEMFLFDYRNKNFTNFKFNITVHYSENIFKLNGYKSLVYLTSYIYCAEKNDINECYLGLRIFKLNHTDIEIILENPEKIPINYKSKLVCFQNDDLYIQCIYNTMEKINNVEKYNHTISLFNYKTLEIVYTEILEEYFQINGIFDSTIQLNGNIFVTGYQYPDKKNVIKLLLKTIKIEKNSESNNIFIVEDYLPNIKYIDINGDETYLLKDFKKEIYFFFFKIF